MGFLLRELLASGNVCAKRQQSNSSSLVLLMGKPLCEEPHIRLDAHQCLSTIRARCGRMANTVFSAEGGEGGGLLGEGLGGSDVKIGVAIHDPPTSCYI